MTADTMSHSDLVLPGQGYDAFVDFLYNAPTQPQLLDMKREEIISASQRFLTPPSNPTSSSTASNPAASSATSPSKSRSSSVKNLGDDWDANYEALKAYHAKHGNCSVPFGKETGPLRSWTERQKKLNASSRLDSEKVNDLKALDFDFTMKVLSTRSINTQPLSTRSINTKPQNSASGGKRDGSPKNLNKENSPTASSPTASNPAASSATSPSKSRSSSVKNLGDDWDANYEALKAYHAKHGNCSVPFGKETGPLRSWTERQKKLNASSRLDSEKVNDLKALDFDFTMKGLSTRSINTQPLSTRSINTKV